MTQQYQSQTNLAKTSRRSVAEKVSFAISLIILGFILALLVYSWITENGQPPLLEAKIDGKIYQENLQFYVPFVVTNEGGKTAESVEITAQLTLSEEEMETGSQQIDYLSAGEKQSGAFIFSTDPSLGKLQLRVASFKLP